LQVNRRQFANLEFQQRFLDSHEACQADDGRFFQTGFAPLSEWYVQQAGVRHGRDAGNQAVFLKVEQDKNGAGFAELAGGEGE
jgi:hypothetical protein